MASFSDQISQFNPYIQELPIEVMAQVGMAKQAQYNQGVQKIQSYIDNVAGMSVSRPVEKEYLESQLNQLGSRLKTVAAGDFSNQQLVNSVGGMAGQIVKDPYIQAAVYSHSNDRAQLAEMEADKKKGKLTPHAEFVYNTKRSEFLNNPNLAGEDGKPVMFTGKYIPSWDLEKNMADEIKLAGDAKYSVDNIFVTDPVTKQIKYDIQTIKDPKTGKERTINNGPIYSEYAVREIHDGRFPEAVKAAIDNVLNRPEAQTELGMRGVYEYRGYNNIDDFVNQYEDQKNKTLKIYTQNKLDLQAKLLSEKDPDIKKELEKMIAQVDNDSIALEKTTADQEAAARGYKNLDAYKAALYSQAVRNRYLNIFNNATVSRQYIDNVGWKAHQEAIKASRDWWQAQEQVKLGRRNAATAERNAAVNEGELALKLDQWKKNPLNALLPPLEKGAQPGEVYAGVMERANQVNEMFDGTKKQLVKQYISLTNPKMSDAEVNSTIAKMIQGDPDYINKQYEFAKADILKNRDNPKYSHIAPLLNEAQSAENAVGATASFLKSVEDQAAAKVGNKFVDFGNLQKGLKNMDLTTEEEDQGIIFASNRGFFQSPTQHKVTLTPKDQVNLAIITNTHLFKSDAEKALVNQAEKDLEASTGRPVNEIKKSLFTKFVKSSDPYFTNLGAVAQKVRSQGFAETLNAKEDIIKNTTLGNSPVSYQLYPQGSDEKTINTIDRNLVAVLNKYKDAGIALGNFENYLAPGKDAKGKYSVEVGVDRSGATPQFSLDLYSGTEKIQSLAVPKADANYVAMKNIEVPSQVSEVAQRLYFNSKKENPTYSTNSLTSNPYNENAYKGAFYNSAMLQVPNAPYLVGGDVFPNYSGGYTPYVYINQGGEIQAFPIKSGKGTDPITYPSVDAAGELIKSIKSKAMVDEIIKNIK